MYPESLQKLIEGFKILPGVGDKTAERYALVVADTDEETIRQFASALIEVKEKLRPCKVCGNLCDGEICDICADPERKHDTILVVQSAKDVIAMEKTGQYHGVYHVLNGAISPAKGILPEELNIDSLLERARQAREIILATSATVDGETTAMYLDKLLKKEVPAVLVTRIAHGLPSGGMLDYADEMTLVHALSDRRKME